MNPLDIPDVAEKFGLFVALAAVVIVALSWVVRALWNRLNEQTDNRFDDHKTHAAQISDNTRTLEQALKIFEGSGRG